MTVERTWNLDPLAVAGSARAVSLVVDPDRRPVVAAWLDVGSESSRLMLFRDEPSGWRRGAVVRTLGSCCSLALDASLTAQVAFVDLERDEVRVARRSPQDSEWTFETVGEFGGLVPTRPELAQATGSTEVVYSGGAGLVHSTRSADGSWTSESIDAAVPSGLDVAFAIDADGNRHAVYRDPFADALVYLRHGQNGWEADEVPWREADETDAFLGDGPSLAVDGDGRPHVAYWCHDGIRHAVLDDGEWATETAIASGGVGPGPSLVIDRDGRPAIAGLDTVSGTVCVARRGDDGWETEEIHTGSSDNGLAASVDLVVDDRGLLHVAFVDETGTPHLARPNTAPVAGPDSFISYVNTRLRGNVLADDTDAEGDRLRIETSPHRTPRHGRVTLQANGRFTYVPNMGFNGTDGFRYELLEEGGRSAIGDVAIAVEVPVLIRAVSTPLADQRKSSRIRTSLRSPSLPLMTAVLQRRVRADWNDVREGPAARLTQLARPVQQEWSKGHYRVELRHVDRGYPLARSEEFQMPARRGTDLLLRGDLTSLPNVEPRLTTPKRPARSASEPTPKPKPKPTATPKPPTFDPARAKWGLWPLNASKPQLRRGAKGDAVRYVQGVIAHNAGGNIAVDGDYGMQTWYRVQQVQVFFGLVVDGKVGPETWLVIDELATS